MDLIQRAVKSSHVDNKLPFFRAGDTVEVFVKVKEGEKERVQLYRGIVLKIQGAGVSRSFTVRKMSDGVGVERTFPFSSPVIDKVTVISNGQVRRSKLYYLRRLAGKAAKVKSELVVEESKAPAATEEKMPKAAKGEKAADKSAKKS